METPLRLHRLPTSRGLQVSSSSFFVRVLRLEIPLTIYFRNVYVYPIPTFVFSQHLFTNVFLGPTIHPSTPLCVSGDPLNKGS